MESIFGFIGSPLLWISIALLYTLKKSVLIVPQNMGYVIYTLGKYSGTRSAGLSFIVPFLQSVAAKRNLKEQSITVPPQTAITKDNISVQIDAILFIRVMDAAAATNSVTNYKLAVQQLAMTTMRNSIGSMEMDDCFQMRDQINSQILNAMAEATDPWGVQVLRYELKDIAPPENILDDMEKQMSAERERRSVILEAEGVKKSEILRAEGDKQAKVLAAEASKAEQVLKAEATKQEQILEAEGKAKAIALVAEAEANALTKVGEAAVTEEGKAAVNLTLAQKAIEAHRAIADEGTVILSDGQTSNNISETVAQAVSVSNALKDHAA